jgi:hypothetical protein
MILKALLVTGLVLLATCGVSGAARVGDIFDANLSPQALSDALGSFVNRIWVSQLSVAA